MIRNTLLASLLLLLGAPASADDAPIQLLCLDALDVRQTLPILREIAPRARIHADVQTNCFVVVAHPDRYSTLVSMVEQLEVKARSRAAEAVH